MIIDDYWHFAYIIEVIEMAARNAFETAFDANRYSIAHIRLSQGNICPAIAQEYKAIDRIADILAKLGDDSHVEAACRNLDIIAHLTATAENVIGAESRISDVDMAKRMAEQAKISILG